MKKKIIYADDAKLKILEGIEKLYNAVGITLGPKGKNVAIKNGYNMPVIINDGVSIAKEVELEDEMENVGAQLIKEASQKTNDVAGDGTTTATVLAYFMVKNGMKYIMSGANPIEIRKGMQIAKDECIKQIKEISQKVESNERIREIATISAGEKDIGELLFKAIDSVGKDGVITIGESKTSQTRLNIVEGLRVDSGYVSSYMITNDDEKENIDDPYILVSNLKIRSVNEILPILEKVSKSNSPLIMIVDDIEGEALGTILINKMRGTFNCIAIKAPSFGQRRREILEDIAFSVGTRLISQNDVNEIERIELEELGTAKKVRVDKQSTIIIKDSGENSKYENKIGSRINSIREKLKEENDSEEISFLKKRLSTLLGKVAVIEVGASTTTELNEKKLRLEDALSATQAALEEGIVTGGGKAYIQVLSRLKNKFNNYSSDINIGIDIVMKALEKPLWQIANNSGENGDIIIEKVKGLSEEMGYDAINSSFVNMKENGIIDPAKVTRSALENAISIASMIITTDAIICDVNKDE